MNILNDVHFILSARWPGGEGKVRGADEPVRGTAHLTLPSLRDGPLPLPPKGRRGARVADIDGLLAVEHDDSIAPAPDSRTALRIAGEGGPGPQGWVGEGASEQTSRRRRIGLLGGSFNPA